MEWIMFSQGIIMLASRRNSRVESKVPHIIHSKTCSQRPLTSWHSLKNKSVWNAEDKAMNCEHEQMICRYFSQAPIWAESLIGGYHPLRSRILTPSAINVMLWCLSGGFSPTRIWHASCGWRFPVFGFFEAVTVEQLFYDIFLFSLDHKNTMV